MSLEDIRSECSETAALLQPYVDGELRDEERERVAEHLASCSPCRAAVGEQLWVQATLRAAGAEPAPQALRARILNALDDVDREHARARAESTPASRPKRWTRWRSLLRGGLVMVPAGAVGAVLFVVARQGALSTEPLEPTTFAAAIATHAPSPDEDVFTAIERLEPEVGFPIQVAQPEPSQEVQLVGARVDEGDGGPAARLRYRVFRRGRATGQHVVDRQLRAGRKSAQGTPVTFRGRQYLLDWAEGGAPVVHFEHSGVSHTLLLEDPEARHPNPQAPEQSPDFSLLLDFADRNLPARHMPGPR